MKKLRKTFALLLAVIMAMITNFPSGLFPGIDIGLTVYAADTITFEALEGTPGANTSEDLDMLIDGDKSTKWVITDFSEYLEPCYIVFKASKPINVNGYTITTGNDNTEYTGRNPKNWTLQGCNDYDAEEGTESWETIDTVENDDKLQDENNKDYVFQFAVTETAYQYFKFEITAIKGAQDNCMQMSEFTLSYTDTTCEHTWGTEPTRTIAPTCTEGGYDVYTCTKCQGEKKVANESAVPGHKKGQDGKCTGCGIYMISNAAELKTFAAAVNGGEGNANAILTTDITVNNAVFNGNGKLNSGLESWTPIGSNTNQYTGTFDGQGHTISGLYFDDSTADYVGLFGSVEDDGIVSSVGVIDSYFRGGSYVGGVCGQNGGTITNCYNTGKVSSSGDYVGGVCGCTLEEITNCYNTGEVSSSSEQVGGVCGYFEGYVLNCYYRKDCNGENTTFSSIIAGISTESSQFGSGEVAYLLSRGGNSVWGQKLGDDADAYPVLKKAGDEGNTVYQNIKYSGCSASNPGESTYVYANEAADPVYAAHNYVNDVCSVCGASKPILEIDEEHFPDVNFREYVNTNCDTDGDGWLSAAEIAGVTSIECFNEDISNLKGIEYFTELTYLECYGNQLTSLDVSKNTALTYLDCSGNQLTSLNVSKNTALEYLICTDNQLTSLNVSSITALDYLDCSDNTYEITLDNGTFELSTLPGTFDVGKAGNWTGGKLSEDKKTLTFDSGVTKVTYDYDCGRNFSVTFTLDATLDTNPKYTVSFDANGGTLSGNQTAQTDDNGKLDSLPTPTREGYTFDGWYTEAAAGTKVTTETKFTEDTTIYARWTENVSTPDDVDINEENFPDANFRDYVQKNFDKDSNGTLSADEIAKVTKINCSYMSIASLEGIAYFTELKELSCYINNLTALDVSQNTALTILYCGSNNLTALSVSQNKELQKLSCNGNQLTALDVSQNMALTSLDCSDNQLTSLKLGGNTVLNYLTCDGNDLTALDVSRNTALSILRCYDNQLTVLDVSNNTKLTDLNCGTNQLTSLNLGSNTKLSSSSPIAGGNAYEIKPENGTFDLTTLPGDFDVSKASSWVGGSVSGTTLTVEKDTVLVTYNYDFGNGKSATFTLLVNDAGTEIAIDEAHFPDMVFRKYVAGSDANIDRNRDGKLSAGEIAMVKTVNVKVMAAGLRDLTGITYFTQLESLDCRDCENLRVLDVSQNTKLSELLCSGSALTSLDLSNNTALTNLDAGNNVYPIKLDENRNFDLTTLPGKFELSKAGNNWQGGSVSGTTLTLDSDATEVTYDYDCGNDKTVTFTLKVEYTVTAYGLYGTDLESSPGEAYVRDHIYNDWVYLGIGKRDGYTLQNLTLEGIAESDLNWEHKDEETDDRQISFKMPANDVTVTANWKKNAANQAVNKKYLYARENADSIDLSSYLPKDCGAVTYGAPQVEGELYTENGAPAISNDTLSYTVKEGTVGETGTIQVKVTTDHYTDYTITIHVELIDKITVSLREGSFVSLENSTLTYGEALSTLTFKSAVFVGDGKTVAGKLAFKDETIKPSVGTTTAEWVFTPTSAEYVSVEGEVVITVKKATPNVETDPTVAARTYHPTVALKNSDLTGSEVKSVSGNTLTGTWSWEDAEVIPTVENSGYTAVFTPNGADSANYETVTRTITVSVEPATPYIKEAPTAAAITYGKTLADATLTDGSVQYSDSDATNVAGSFAWADAAIKPAVSDSGMTEYTVVFHPTDTVNYNTAEIKVTLTVNKAENAPGMPESTMRVSYTKKTVGEVELPANWSWKDADQAKELTVGEAETATAVYTGADAENGNYETESVEISITRQPCTHDGETEKRDERAATCTKKGYTGDTYCKDCGKLLESGTETEMAPHTYVNGVCSVCDEIFKTTVNGVTYQVMTETGADGKPVGKLVTVSGNEVPQVAVAVTGTGDDFTEKNPDGKVTVPSEITGSGSEQTFAVTKISENAFAGEALNAVTEIVVPATVAEVGTGAFGGATTITFNGTTAPLGIAGAISEAVTTVNVPEGAADSYRAALKDVIDDSVTIVEIHIHTFDTKWTYDETGHWKATTCGHDSEEGALDIQPHTFGEWTVTKEATEDAKGLKERSCVCGYKETEEIEKLAHTTHVKDEGTRVEPTCENKGSITYKCIKCGEVMEVVELAALSHKWDGGTVTKEPTETAEGEKTYTCPACGGTKTETIPKKEAAAPQPPKDDTVTPQPPKDDTVTPQPPKKGDVVEDDKGIAKVEIANVAKKEVTYKGPVNKKAKTVIIPATVTIDGVTYKVTKIADNAFKGNKTVTKVIIGSNIKTIGKNAFSGATKLKTVKIGKNVTEVGTNAFKGCTSLTSVTLPGKTTKIGANAFNGCKKLKTIKITSTKLTSKTVAKNAFKGLTKATTIKVPKKKLAAYKKLLKSKGLSSKVTVKRY